MVFAVSVKLIVPERESSGEAAVTERTCIPLNFSPPRRVKLEFMKLTPTLTPPSPVVNARSANDGPNVVAVRT